MSQKPAFSKLQLAGQNMSDDSSSSVDNVGLLSRDRWGGSWPAWIKSQLFVAHRGTSSLQFSDSDLEQGVQGGPVGVGVGTQGKPGRSRHARCAMAHEPDNSGKKNNVLKQPQHTDCTSTELKGRVLVQSCQGWSRTPLMKTFHPLR